MSKLIDLACNIHKPGTKWWMLFVLVLANGMCVVPTLAQSLQGKKTPSTSPSAASSHGHKVSPYHPAGLPSSARGYYQSIWGIDNLLVRQTASSNLIRFSYRVTDPALAKPLGDNRAKPYLVGQRSHAVLEIPVMDKIGQLRQTGTAEAGKEYWMVFSNKGNLVKSGDRVNVVIGAFHVDGLIVE